MQLPTREELSLRLATRTLRDVLAISAGARPKTRLGTVEGTVRMALAHLQHTGTNGTRDDTRQLTLNL